MKIIFFPFLIFLNSTKYLSYCIPVEYLWKLLLVSVISIAPLIQTSLDETYLSYKLRKAWQNIQLNFLSITQSSKCLLLWVCQKKKKTKSMGKKFKKFPFTTLFLLSGVSPGFTDPMDFPWKRAKEWNNRVGAFAGFFWWFCVKKRVGILWHVQWRCQAFWKLLLLPYTMHLVCFPPWENQTHPRHSLFPHIKYMKMLCKLSRAFFSYPKLKAQFHSLMLVWHKMLKRYWGAFWGSNFTCQQYE